MVRISALPVILSALALAAGASRARADGPLISELLAENAGSSLDEDGDASDWIEIHNPTREPVDLSGWSLTDDPTRPTRWRFPPVTIPAGGFLVVYASAKDRADPAGPLHTSFKLDSKGGYLALVAPDGVTVAPGLDTSYPRQYGDYSYGIRQDAAATELVAAGAAARVLVPADAGLGASWTAAGFDDSSWTAGATGVGFDAGGAYASLIATDITAAMAGVAPSAYLRIPFQSPDPSAFGVLRLRMRYDDGFVAWLNGHEVARRNAPDALAFDSLATAAHGHGVSQTMAQDFDDPGTPYTLKAYGNQVLPIVKTAGPSGSFLHLMEDMTGNLSNTIGFDRAFDPAGDYAIDFDFRMSPDSFERADGFGFALLDTSVYGASGPAPGTGTVWERPAFPSVFGVGFDIWNGQGTENTVSLDWNGAEVGAVLVTAFPLNTGAFEHARIEVRRDGADSLVTVILTPDSLGTPGTPVTVFQDYRIAGMGPFDARVAFGGRTGGSFTELDLDNIRVVTNPLEFSLAPEEIDLSAAIPFLQAGPNVLAIQGLNLDAADPDFLVLPELEALAITEGSPDDPRYFTAPTPGAPNGAGYPGVAEEPSFSAPGGTSAKAFALTLKVKSPAAAIHYTTDRTEPTEASPAYTKAISIATSTLVRARAFEPGLAPGPLQSEGYLVLDSTAGSFTSDLPLIVFHTFAQGVSDAGYTPVYAAVLDGKGDRTALAGAASWAGQAAVKWHGSSSLQFPKKHFAFEVRDEHGNDKDVSLLGFPSQSDWLLFAPYDDKTMMRDVLAYDWSNRIGRYAVRTRFIELYANFSGGKVTSADYQGVYVLMERIKRDPHRVDIEKLYRSETTEPGITGGYLVKKDRLDPGDSGLATSSGQVLGWVDPKEHEASPAEKAWFVGYLNAFEAALYGSKFTDPAVGFRKYIDVDSFIDHHLLVEMLKNIDGFRLSTFMFKDREDKLNMGPIWDYNLSLGNANYLEGWLPNGWYYPQLSDGDYPWWRRIFQDADFYQRYRDRWAELRRTALTTDQMLADVDGYAAVLAESQVRNYKKWPILGQYVWPNWFIGKTYQDEVNWMEDWLSQRLDWIDSQLGAGPVFSQQGGAIAAGFQLGISAPVGTIYYTLDGTDPRRPGGALAAGALTYKGPVTLGQNTRVTARAATGSVSKLTWTPSNAATFVTGNPALAVTEVMYHPAHPPAASPYGEEDFEFIEVENVGPDVAQLVGVRFTNGISFDFTGGKVASLGPGEYAVVVRNLAAFSTRYATAGMKIAGEYAGTLENGGERIVLVGPLGDPLADFTYDDAWYPETDGGGPSLVAVDVHQPAAAWSDRSGWRPSGAAGGSPGAADPGAQQGMRLPGDANGDGALDLSDAVALLLQLFGSGGPALPCGGTGVTDGGNRAVLDVTGDGAVDISDAIALLAYLYTSGRAPALGAVCVPVSGCADACAP